MSEWQPIETAPKDGTQILAWVRHDNWQYAKTDLERAAWEGPSVAEWTDFNGGGWTWHGMCGAFLGDYIFELIGSRASVCPTGRYSAGHDPGR